MNLLATHLPAILSKLAAAEPSIPTRAQRIFESWSDTSTVFPVQTLGYIFLGLLMVLLALWLRQWYQQRPIDPTPNHLFRKLAREVHLGLWDQWLLLRIARQQKLPSPLTLLLARDTLLYHGKAYAKDVVTVRSPMIYRRVQRVAEKLFGSSQQTQRDIQLAMTNAGFDDPPQPSPASPAGLNQSSAGAATA